MTNFLDVVANSVNIQESLLFYDYFDLVQKNIDLNTLYKARGSKYITTLLYLIRVPFRYEKALLLGGLKDVFYDLILKLYDIDQELAIRILKNTIYWKDLLNIWAKINKMNIDKKEKFAKYDFLIRSIRHIINDQRSIDLKKVKSGDYNISLLGKYCVAENSHFDNKAYWYNITQDGLKKDLHVSFMIRDRLHVASGSKRSNYPETKTVPFKTKKIWRKDNALLKQVLNIPEISLCSKDYEELEEMFIPNICYKKNYSIMKQNKIDKKKNSYGSLVEKVIDSINDVASYSYSE